MVQQSYGIDLGFWAWRCDMLHHVVVGDGAPISILQGPSPHDGELRARFSDNVWLETHIRGHARARSEPATERYQHADNLLKAVFCFVDEVLPNKRHGIIDESYGRWKTRLHVWVPGHN